MGFLTAFGTGVLQGVHDEQNRVRDERAEMTRLAMERLRTTIDRRERELEERTKIEQRAAMIARSTGADPAAVRAALESGADFNEILSGRVTFGRAGAPAAAAGAPAAPAGGEPAAGAGPLLARPGPLGSAPAALAGPLPTTPAPATASAPAAPPVEAAAPVTEAPTMDPRAGASDPVLDRYRNPEAPQGPVSRGVMDYVFGRQSPERINQDATRRLAGAYGMSPERIAELQRPLPRTQMPEGATISRSAFDPERLADPKNFNRGEDFARAYPGAPAGVMTAGDKARLEAEQAERVARIRAAGRGEGSGRVPVGYFNATSTALARMAGTGGNSPFIAVPNPEAPGSLMLQPRALPDSPDYQAHMALINQAEVNAQRIVNESGGRVTPAEAAMRALQSLNLPGSGTTPPNGAATAQQAPREAARPTNSPAQVPPPANRVAGQTYQTPRGPMKWTREGWVQP